MTKGEDRDLSNQTMSKPISVSGRVMRRKRIRRSNAHQRRVALCSTDKPATSHSSIVHDPSLCKAAQSTLSNRQHPQVFDPHRKQERWVDLPQSSNKEEKNLWNREIGIYFEGGALAKSEQVKAQKEEHVRRFALA